MTGGIAYISRDDLDASLKVWEEGQKEYERAKKESLLEDIFREYRTERGKEVKKVG
jgi:predicted RNase H-like nuclease (RuvC/YqgF family)